MIQITYIFSVMMYLFRNRLHSIIAAFLHDKMKLFLQSVIFFVKFIVTIKYYRYENS